MVNIFKYQLNYCISKTKVNETITFHKVIICHMYKTPQISRIIQRVYPPNNIGQYAPKKAPYSQETYSFKKQSKVVQELAIDDTGKHPHLLQKICTKTTCDVTQCPTLCGNLNEVRTKGFFTHKPIAGKYCQFISDIDAQNKNDTQYFVKNNDKTKKISAPEAQAYEKNKEMKSNIPMNNYIQQPEIHEKLP